MLHVGFKWKFVKQLKICTVENIKRTLIFKSEFFGKAIFPICQFICYIQLILNFDDYWIVLIYFDICSYDWKKNNTFKNCDKNIIVCFTTTFYKLCNQIIRFLIWKMKLPMPLWIYIFFDLFWQDVGGRNKRKNKK